MVFLDTEFTDLISPALLSFSMVSRDGPEIYAELDLVLDPVGHKRLRASSEFTRHTVIPQFGRMPKSKCSARELGNRAGEWLIARAAVAGGQITVAYDFDDDFALLKDAMMEACIWDRVRSLLAPENIHSITGRVEGELAAEASWLESSLYRGLERHHALADALALRAAWRAVCGS
ncbi:hypothetical protein [Roseateles violae]|uniref:Uncharacterized protein n=1 Tax=Roseateles violae TaxID=3058042 RepID=A0ABT8DWB1_9BURK|nr:hypothetical protein [Pelomonas sp. PFR6]MDN3922522.1 hypothetical protein [Pelomonas sp. PFR6]